MPSARSTLQFIGLPQAQSGTAPVASHSRQSGSGSEKTSTHRQGTVWSSAVTGVLAL